MLSKISKGLARSLKPTQVSLAVARTITNTCPLDYLLLRCEKFRQLKQ